MSKLSNNLNDTHRAFINNITELGLALDTNPLLKMEYKIKENLINHLSWSHHTHLSYLFSEHFSIKQYIELLKKRDFTLLLRDGAAIQIEYKIEKNTVLKHRLCYFPSPINYQDIDLYEMSLEEYLQCLSAKELISEAKLVTPIRFDYDCNFQDDKHANSHLTLNKNSFRLPVYGPIDMAKFFKFIIRYFYEEYFFKIELWDGVVQYINTNTLSSPDMHEFYFNSAQKK